MTVSSEMKSVIEEMENLIKKNTNNPEAIRPELIDHISELDRLADSLDD